MTTPSALPPIWPHQSQRFWADIDIPPRLWSFDEFEKRVDDYGLTHAGKAYVRARIASGPSQQPSSYRNSVVSDWFSEKMQHTVVSASRTCEAMLYSLLDALRSVDFFLEQPGQVKFTRPDKNGTLRTLGYTPDALVFTQRKVFAVECKTEDELFRLSATLPNNYKIEGGKFRYIQAADYFTELGIEHTCWHPNARTQLLAQNLRTIQSAARAVAVDAAKAASLKQELAKTEVCTARSLLNKAGLSDATQLYLLIGSREVAAPLDIVSFSQLDSLWVATTLQAATSATERGLECLFSPETSRTGRVEGVSTTEFERAIQKLHRAETDLTSRTGRYYRQLIRAGKDNGKTPIEALLRKRLDPESDGRFGNKLNACVKSGIQHFIQTRPFDRRARNKSAIYDEYFALAQELHPAHPPACKPTLFKYLSAEWSIKEIAGFEMGARGENSSRCPSEPSSRTIGAVRPFERCLVDNYHADCFVKVLETDSEIWYARPVITALVDLATNMILAVSISLEEPSRRSVGRLLRLCIRLHGRLYEELVSDNGSDFRSIYTRAVGANYGASTTATGPEDGRSGGHAETLFNGLKLMRLQHLEGSFASNKTPRSISRTHRPTARNIIDLNDFVQQVSAHCTWRNKERLTSRFESSSVTFQTLMDQAPFSGKVIEDMDHMQVATAIDYGKHKVEPGKGIRHGAKKFWNAAMSTALGERVEFRIDPENPNLGYALISGLWRPCTSAGYETWTQKSPVERAVDSLLAELPARLTAAQDRSSRTKNQKSIFSPTPTFLGKSRADNKTESPTARPARQTNPQTSKRPKLKVTSWQ